MRTPLRLPAGLPWRIVADDRGFTLLEVMLAILLMTIGLVAAAGIFSSQAAQDQIDTAGTGQFYDGAAVLPLVPTFYSFTQISGEDRPGGQP